jgi:C1A family cysteine protease
VDNTRLEIYNNGPVTAIFQVCQSFYNFFNDQSNKAQVYTTSCTTSSSDYVGGHAISIVGWGTNANGVAYWLIENSWGVNWGDSGSYPAANFITITIYINIFY